MKKIILILNHVTAGMGSDEQAQLPPSGKKTALGPGETLAPLFKEKRQRLLLLYTAVIVIIQVIQKKSNKNLSDSPKSLKQMRYYVDQLCIILILERWQAG